MARTRLLKPEFFRSEDIAALSPLARLFFQGLWGLADRDGRLLDRPRRLALEILPYDDVDGEALLAEIAKNPGLIVRYVTPDGKICIQITNFAKHQTPHFREPSLGLPGPQQDHVGQSPGLPGKAEESPVRPAPSGYGSGSGSGDGSESLPPACDPTPSDQGTELTTGALMAVWATARNAEFGGHPMDVRGFGIKSEKQRDAVEMVNAIPGAAKHVDASMRRFWASVKAGTFDGAETAARSAAFAFSSWADGFMGDFEAATGARPVIPARARATGPPTGGRYGTARAEDQKHTKSGEVEV